MLTLRRVKLNVFNTGVFFYLQDGADVAGITYRLNLQSYQTIVNAKRNC